IAKNSVNTLPHETVIAFLDHGNPKITIEDNIKEAGEDLKQLEKFGIDIEKVCSQIQLDGIKAFQDAFNKLIKSIENK
ncbi:transaldolase, partial [Candidatus Desantisbacteria bacterium]|nr:transaldolase [Candidatus Desantisbacteria bacterium]